MASNKQTVEDFQDHYSSGTTEPRQELTGGSSGKPGDGSGGGNSFVLYDHPAHKAALEGWQYVDDHYTGDCIRPDRVSRYILQRKSVEHDDDYAERVADADPLGYLAFVIDTFSGMIRAADEDTVTQWADGADPSPADSLGDPADPRSVAYARSRRYGEDGMSWGAFWQAWLIELIKYRQAWTLVLGPSVPGGPALTRIIEPQSVCNWFEQGGRLTDVVVKHIVDGRGGIEDAPYDIERRTHYHRDGFDVYEIRKDRDGKRVAIYRPDLSGSYAYYEDATPRAEYARLPIFRTRLASRRDASYMGARRENVLLNRISERNAALRRGMIPRLVIRGMESEYESATASIGRGATALRQDPDIAGEHYFLTPPHAHIASASDVIKAGTADFMLTMFREYASSAPAQQTATKTRQDFRAGLEAFLWLVIDSLTEAQQTALQIEEQLHFPERPNVWGQTDVRRTPDFSKIITETVLSEVATRIFGSGTVPVGLAATVSAAKMLADKWGLEYDDDELTTAVEARLAASSQSDDALSAFNLS